MASRLAHAIALAAAALLLAVAAQPFGTDDAWWHLALGRSFAAEGPWLTEDPLLYAATGPPSTAAWGFDVLLHGVHQAAGFAGLRGLHVALVALDLVLAWALLFRAGAPAPVASAGFVAFVALSAYRLAQLRPHLLSIAFALALLHLLIVSRAPPSARRIAVTAALMALWANVHAAFPLGLVLLGAAVFGAAVQARLVAGGPEDRARAWRLGWAWLAGLAATLCNPAGLRAHAAWFAAGITTPSLGRVMDEWAPLDPFAWPQPTLPPTPLAWGLAWLLLVATLGLLVRAVAPLRAARHRERVDPALLSAALASLVLMLGAVRFLWLGLVPLALLTGALPRPTRPVQAWAVALSAAVGLAGFLRWGDWPLVTRDLPRSAERWTEPYAAPKYYPDPVWIARDAGLEGHLHTDYNRAGFAGFWLAPRIRSLVNGTLNVPEQTLRAAAAIERRVGTADVASFTALLDRVELDLFIGIRLPETGNPFRPWSWTTGHLDRTPGWLPLFRSLDASLFLRDVPRNRQNLQRAARFYAAEGVPFDPRRGFEPLRVAREAPEWAHARGVVPRNFATLEHLARTDPGARGEGARHRLAALYTALGAHTEAAEIDAALLERKPQHVRARRRLVWNLLHLDRDAEAREEAQALGERPARDRVSRAIAEATADFASLSPEQARARLAALPVFTRSEVPWILRGTPNPKPRLGSSPDDPGSPG